MMKQRPIYLDLALAEAQMEAARNRKAELMDRIIHRLRHVISLCKPLTGFPTFHYSIDLQRSKIKATKSKISIMRWFPEGVGWEHVRYIDIPTIWLEESTADANITAHLEAWLTERQARRDRRRQEEIEKKEKNDQKWIDDLIALSESQGHTRAVEELKKLKLTKK